MASLTCTDCNLEISAVYCYLAFSSDALVDCRDIKFTGLYINIAAFVIDLDRVVSGIQGHHSFCHSQTVIDMDRILGGCHCKVSAGYDQIVIGSYAMCRTA